MEGRKEGRKEGREGSALPPSLSLLFAPGVDGKTVVVAKAAGRARRPFGVKGQRRSGERSLALRLSYRSGKGAAAKLTATLTQVRVQIREGLAVHCILALAISIWIGRKRRIVSEYNFQGKPETALS